MEWKYGYCKNCNAKLQPVWFTQEEYKDGYKTGKTRQAIDVLVCPDCLKEHIVDDSFDGPWR